MALSPPNNNSLLQLLATSCRVFNAGWRPFTWNLTRNLECDGEKAYAVTDFETCKIDIDCDMDYDTTRETILHEINHIIAETVGLDNTTSGVISVTNEEFVTRFSRGMMLVMNLNSELFKALLPNNMESRTLRTEGGDHAREVE